MFDRASAIAKLLEQFGVALPQFQIAGIRPQRALAGAERLVPRGGRVVFRLQPADIRLPGGLLPAMVHLLRERRTAGHQRHGLLHLQAAAAGQRDALRTNLKRNRLVRTGGLLAHPLGQGNGELPEEGRGQQVVALGTQMHVFVKVIVAGKRAFRPCLVFQHLLEIDQRYAVRGPLGCDLADGLVDAAVGAEAQGIEVPGENKVLSGVLEISRFQQRLRQAEMRVGKALVGGEGPLEFGGGLRVLSLSGELLSGPAMGVALFALCGVEIRGRVRTTEEHSP